MPRPSRGEVLESDPGAGGDVHQVCLLRVQLAPGDEDHTGLHLGGAAEREPVGGGEVEGGREGVGRAEDLRGTCAGIFGENVVCYVNFMD